MEKAVAHFNFDFLSSLLWQWYSYPVLPLKGIKMDLPGRCETTKEAHHEQEVQETLSLDLRV
jgi:hypothetical protein